MHRTVCLASLLLWITGCEDRPTDWSYISAIIIQPNCATASCHSREAKVANVDLSGIDSGYNAMVVDPQSPDAATRTPFVVPFQPEQSRLLYLLRAEATRRMPRDAPLPPSDITLIEEWIREGAPRR
jgi:hypothetical protein